VSPTITMQPPVSECSSAAAPAAVDCGLLVGSPAAPACPTEHHASTRVPPAAAGQTQWQRPADAATAAAPAAATAAAPWQRPAAAPAAAPAAEDGRLYLPAMQFGGARPGYVFKTGPSGLGYYMDRPDTERRLGALLLPAGLAWQYCCLLTAECVRWCGCSCWATGLTSADPVLLCFPLLRCRW
jgi:hypothetical protein